MTVQEVKAKEVLNNIWDFADAQDEEKGDVVDDAVIEAIGCMEEVEQYRALGTVEELKEAREKQVAKKPNIQKTDDKALFKCPCCDNVLLEEFYGVVTLRHGQITKHCEKCGQAIDKSEME